jgi:uncharacterized membrane protein
MKHAFEMTSTSASMHTRGADGRELATGRRAFFSAQPGEAPMFLSKTLWRLRELVSQVWTRVALFSLIAIATTGVAPVVAPFLPDDVDFSFGRPATMELLSILTSSMLTVATFSLSVMVAAHHFAAGQVTPRSHRLLRADGRTQSVIATFIGAFVYALTATAVINLNVYAESHFPVIYGVTILVIVLVIVALIRWVQQLSGLGSIERTAARVESVAREALAQRMRAPHFGGAPLRAGDRRIGRAVEAHGWGYVQHVDVQALSERAVELGLEIALLVLPGDQVVPGDLLMRVQGGTPPPDGSRDEVLLRELCDKVTIGEARSFDQDPVFGVQVLAEVGQRALSPGINDPRTAEDVIARQMRLLGAWDARAADDPLPSVRARGLDMREVIETALDGIARDGAAVLEVQMALQGALAVLARHDDPAIRAAALEVSRRALLRSDAALELAEDRARVRTRAPAAPSGAPRAVGT